MGLVTTVVINNDAINTIEEDPNFGRWLAEAIHRNVIPNPDGPIPVHTHSYRNGEMCKPQVGAYVIESHHADGIVLVAVGHGAGAPIHKGYLTLDVESKEDPQELVLKAFAEELGYTVRKKPSKKKTSKKSSKKKKYSKRRNKSKRKRR